MATYPLPAAPTFGALLRRYRLAAGLSQEELAERAGVSARAVSDLERGQRQVPYPTPSANWRGRWGWARPSAPG